MAEFNVNVHRRDPYRNFNFRIILDGEVVAGVTKVSALRRITEPVEYRTGHEETSSRTAPGPTRFEPITLERGITHDPVFEQWARLSFDPAQGQPGSLKDYRKDLVIELLNLAGQVVARYQVRRAWVSEFQALPELDANGNAVAIQMIKLEHEGFDRDPSVEEPAED